MKINIARIIYIILGVLFLIIYLLSDWTKDTLQNLLLFSLGTGYVFSLILIIGIYVADNWDN